MTRFDPTKTIDAAVQACFPSASDEFKAEAKNSLGRIVQQRNDFHVRTEYLSPVNRVLWYRYNNLLRSAYVLD